MGLASCLGGRGKKMRNRQHETLSIDARNPNLPDMGVLSFDQVRVYEQPQDPARADHGR